MQSFFAGFETSIQRVSDCGTKEKMEKLLDDWSERAEVTSNVVKFLRGSFAEIKHRQRNLDLARESVVERMMEIETLRESYEKGLKDLEEKELNFCAFKEGKKRKLALEEGELSVSKEQGLKTKIEVLVEDAKLMDEQLVKREKLGNQLLERLKLAQDNVEHLKQTVQEKFKQVGLKEIEVKSIMDLAEKKMDELDSKAAELEKKEESLIYKEIKLEEKLKELSLKEEALQSRHKALKLKDKNLRSWKKELEVKQGKVNSVQELNQRRLEELDLKEKSMNSVKKLTGDCFKEHIAIKKQLLLEKDLIKRREKDLDLNESVDLKFILRMDGRTLQMFLNDPKKDLDSMGDEIFQVLHLSCDPAKLILDAMVGFYPPHLRKSDVEIDVRRTCIILLEQLSKMTKTIQPNTRKEAIELASSWKSKMGANGGDPLEVLGFLRLLAAYNLASYFDKHEILGFLKIADQLRQIPLQFCVSGFEDNFTDSTVEIRSQPASEEVKT